MGTDSQRSFISIYQVDAFTDKPFHGNPAAICLLERPAEDQWMQQFAAEMNLAETAFVRPLSEGFELRWFTPTIEVDMCGHATLASAHVLWESGGLDIDQPARFQTRSGLLTCIRRENWIEMDFPSVPALPAGAPDGLLPALGLEARDAVVARSKFDYLVEIGSEQKLCALSPDFRSLKAVDARGVIVTARAADPPFDFVSRFFAPQSGIDEDPVTGSAHCTLGPWWRGRLGAPKDQMLAFQASARGGTVRVKLQGDRVLLGGQAVTILRGQIVT